jgi:large subunit ribosomal protein L4
MLSVPVYNRDGQKVGEESIDPALLGGEVNKQLLHDVVLMHRANSRVGTVNTRGRGDVAGSTKKMYRQKGTGNARMGSKRTHKRVGGGVAFARRNRDYSQRLPKRVVRQAVRMALLSKFRDGQALVIEGLGTTNPDTAPKTRDIARVLLAIRRPDLPEGVSAVPPVDVEHLHRSGRLGARKRALLAQGQPIGTQPDSKAAARKATLYQSRILIGTPGHDPILHRSARNIAGVQVAQVSEFNTYDILAQRYLVLTREAFETLKQKVQEPVQRRAEGNDAETEN